MKIKTIFFFLIILFNHSARAATGDIISAQIQAVGLILIASGGHQAGNFEIQVANGFTVPPGLNCSSPYITTLKTVDTDKRMFSLLSLAQVTKQTVNLRITDDPAYAAFPGRCSLVWALMTQ